MLDDQILANDLISFDNFHSFLDDAQGEILIVL